MVSTAKGYHPPKRNSAGGGQFDAGNSGKPAGTARQPNTNRDASSGESRNTAGVHRTGQERRAGTARKPKK